MLGTYFCSLVARIFSAFLCTVFVNLCLWEKEKWEVEFQQTRNHTKSIHLWFISQKSLSTFASAFDSTHSFGWTAADKGWFWTPHYSFYCLYCLLYIFLSETYDTNLECSYYTSGWLETTCWNLFMDYISLCPMPWPSTFTQVFSVCPVFGQSG